MNPIPGVIFHAMGGLAAVSCYAPCKKVKGWSWETYWLVLGMFAWIVAPVAMAAGLTPGFVVIIKAVPRDAVFWSYFSGVLWGIGGLTFGLTMRHLGVSLGVSVSLGFCAVFGTLVPPIFAGEFMGLVTSFSGLITLAGVALCLLGIGICGKAGMMKERDLSAEEKAESITEFDFKKGIWVAIVAGVLSACMAYAFQAGAPRQEMAVEQGVPSLGIALLTCATLQAGAVQQTEANTVIEISFQTQKQYANPFTDVELDVLFTDPGGNQLRVPTFWAGGDMWKVRYASPLTGTHRYNTMCSDAGDVGLHGVEGQIEIKSYTGDNKLYRHGPLKVAADHRHFEHNDGTPFFWLGDTWWKCLAKRLTWKGFQELAEDRKAKGFSVIQIVAGPYPDEDAFEPMWANEGGWPYHTRDYKELNVAYWDYADRRLQHLIDVELVPAIVGAWGRRDCDAMKVAGVEGLKRHWRYVIARYGAYPVFWILAGELHNESKWGVGPWGEVGRYVRSIDPYQRPITNHTGGGRRGDTKDDLIITYDMVGGSHKQQVAITSAVEILITAYKQEPPMPVLVGETCYEGHMQTGFPYVQRHMFWQYMLSGAAGHTYGAAGIWHASVEGDPGCASSAFGGRRTYDWTTWREGMNYPGAAQLGLGKKLLEEYPWHRFEPHPEWTEEGSFAAGIPGEVRFIYQPRRNIYNWKGTVVNEVETDVPYSAYYFDPATGRRFDQGKVTLSINELGSGSTGTYLAPDLPSPQDWILVLEKAADL